MIDKLNTPARILDAVMELILDGGIQAVTFSAVCRKADISKGGLVHYFPSKESLIDAFIARAGCRYLEMVESALTSAKPGNGNRALAFVDLMLASESALNQGQDGDDCAAVMVALIQSEVRHPVVKELFDTVSNWLIDDGLTFDLALLILITVDGFWFKSVIDDEQDLEDRGMRLRRKLRKLIISEVQGKRSRGKTSKVLRVNGKDQ